MSVFEQILIGIGGATLLALFSLLVYFLYCNIIDKQHEKEMKEIKKEYNYKEKYFNLNEEFKQLELIIEHRQDIIESISSEISGKDKKINRMEEQLYKISSNNESLKKVARLYYDDVDHDKYIKERENHRITKAKLESAKIKIDKLHMEVYK